MRYSKNLDNKENKPKELAKIKGINYWKKRKCNFSLKKI
jgi:hypothetical protein